MQLHWSSQKCVVSNYVCIYSAGMKEKKDTNLIVRVNADTKAKAREMAAAEGTTLSDEVNRVLRKWARKYERREK